MSKKKTPAENFDDKYKVVNALLEEEFILVHLSTEEEGISIPEKLKVQPTVTLKLSRRFRGAMELKQDRIEADLLFDGEYFSCVIPWKALWGVSTPKGMGRIWTESIPAAVASQFAGAEKATCSESATDDIAASAAPPSAKGRPTLRRIK